MKKFLSGLIMVSIMCSAMGGFASEYDETQNPSIKEQQQIFTDVPTNHWAYEYISEMVDRGVLNGYPDRTFLPDNEVQRCEFAKIMIAAAEINVVDKGITSFSDVSSDAWYAPYIESAKEYLTGYAGQSGSLLFKPESPALREDIAVALVKLKGYDVSKANLNVLDSFTDLYSISEGIKKYVATAVERGLINGYDDGTFRGQESITRAQAATLLWRAYQYGSDNKVTDIGNNGVNTQPTSAPVSTNIPSVTANPNATNSPTQTSTPTQTNAPTSTDAPASSSNPNTPTSAPVASPIKSLTLTSSKTTLEINETVKVSYSTTPANILLSSVTYASSANNVATIDAEGNIKAIGKGTATITATAADSFNNKKTATVRITVNAAAVALQSVVIKQPSTSPYYHPATIYLKGYMQLTPSNASVAKTEWFSSNPEIATIDNDGKFATAGGSGVTTIKAVVTDKLGNVRESSVSITVNAVTITELTISEVKDQLFVGDSKTLTKKYNPTGVKIAKDEWKSSDTTVATVTSSGKVAAIAPGSATISYTATDSTGKTMTASTIIQVKAKYTATVSFSKNEYNILKGETVPIEFVVSPSNAVIKSVSLSASPSGIITASSTNRTIKGSKGGVTTLTATVTMEDGVKYTTQATVTVTVP